MSSAAGTRTGRPGTAERAVGPGRPPWWLVAGCAALTAAITADLLAGGVLETVDERAAAVIGGWDLRHGAGYPLLWLATQLGGRVSLVAVLAVLAGWPAWRRRALRPLARAVLAVALLTAVVYAFKYGAGRTAPAFPGSFFHRGGESFPSGHVANAVVVWGVVRWQAVAYRLAPWLQRAAAVLSVAGPAVAGLAMVALDFHWVTDAVAGATVGIVVLGVVHALDGVALSRWVRARAGRRSA